jgi:DnaK suppressor protein
MQTVEYKAFAQELRRQRAELLEEFGHTENDLHKMGEERESEWTETAVEEQQRHLLTNLDSRARETLGEMNAALQRIDNGSYGFCARCHVPISFARLQAVPTTLFWAFIYFTHPLHEHGTLTDLGLCATTLRQRLASIFRRLCADPRVSVSQIYYCPHKASH